MSSERMLLHRRLAAAALVQGVLADALLRAAPWGVNLAVWAAVVAGGIAWVAWSTRQRLPAASWGWFLAAWACSASFTGRASGPLAALTVVGGVGCLVLGAWSARGGTPGNAVPTVWLIEAILTVLSAVLGGLTWVVSAAVGAPASVPGSEGKPTRLWLRALVGAVFAIPALIVFGTLFAAADPVFAKGLRGLTALDYQTLASHGFMTGFRAWICFGYGRRALVPSEDAWARRLVPNPPVRPPTTEVVSGLGLVAILFLAFVLVQIRYLYGTDDLVRSTVGMTYAEYARHGFFELLAVAVLLLPLLLACDWLLGSASNRRVFRWVAGSLLLLLGAILLSAVKRLALYTAAYGLTEQRLYAAAALIWLAVVSGWFAATVLPGRRERFAGGAALTALAAVFGLHVLNPDAFIARHNLARAREGLRFDVSHFLSLGADAAPVLLQGMSVLPAADQTRIREALEKRWHEPGADWRIWNWARAQARRAVVERGTR